MTLYFTNANVNTGRTDFFLDGDWSGITLANPTGWATIALRLKSRWTNSNITDDDIRWHFNLNLVSANERFTHFFIESAVAKDLIANKFYSGYYDFELYGTSLTIDPNQAGFNPEQWELLLEGQTKVKTETTDNMQRGQESETVKYTTDPNTAKSYVIYND